MQRPARRYARRANKSGLAAQGGLSLGGDDAVDLG